MNGRRAPSGPAARVLRLDANEGPLPRVAGEVWSGEELRRYPEARRLEAEIARRLGVPAQRVVATAGASDGLDRACRAFLRPGDELLTPRPTFGMVRRFAALAGAEVRFVDWWGRFPVRRFVAAIDRATAAVVLISPNNPTGSSIDLATLRRVSRAAGERPVLFDHVYADYAAEDLTRQALALPNVLVFRTFSKAWGLAGCRVGYVVAPAAWAERVRAAGGAYPVAAPSLRLAAARLAAGRAAVSRHVAAVRRQRAALFARLRDWGVRAWPSEANFVLADFGAAAERIWRGLNGLGIRVRRFAEPELAGMLRFTVPQGARDGRRLHAALAACLRPEALLFDLDGVLADVDRSYRRCVLETCAELGVEVDRATLDARVREGGCNNDWDLVAALLAARGRRASRAEIRRIFQRRYLGAEGSDGLRTHERLLVSRERLAAWAQRRPLALVTGRPRAEAEWFLERHAIGACFAAVVAMEDAPGKPDPAPVRLALERLGVRHAWMVGDTPDDMVAACAAGAMAVGVVAPGDPPHETREGLSAAGAALVLSRSDELEDLLP